MENRASQNDLGSDFAVCVDLSWAALTLRMVPNQERSLLGRIAKRNPLGSYITVQEDKSL